jgi:hypothetical protein
MALGSPRTFSKTGSAAAGAVSITVPFFPSAIYVENGDSTNAFNINWTTTATATNTGTGADIANIRISAGAKIAFNFGNPNVSNTFVLTLIAVAGTPAFVINATAAR